MPIQPICEGVVWDIVYNADGLAVERGGGETQLIWTVLTEDEWYTLLNFFGWQRGFEGTWALPHRGRMWRYYNGIGTIPDVTYRSGLYLNVALAITRLEVLSF